MSFRIYLLVSKYNKVHEALIHVTEIPCSSNPNVKHWANVSFICGKTSRRRKMGTISDSSSSKSSCLLNYKISGSGHRVIHVNSGKHRRRPRKYAQKGKTDTSEGESQRDTAAKKKNPKPRKSRKQNNDQKIRELFGIQKDCKVVLTRLTWSTDKSKNA